MPTRRNLLATASVLTGAGLAPSLAQAYSTQVNQKVPLECDVLVIGSGAAGLSAAIEASQKATTVLFEKSKALGGNTLISGGAICAVSPDLKSDRSIEKHIFDTLRAGEARGDEALVRKMAECGANTIDWLTSLGVKFTRDFHSVLGTKAAKCLIPCEGSGRGLVLPLITALAKSGVQTYTEINALRVLRLGENGRVIGVQYKNANNETHTISVRKAVVVACGGFSANKRLCSLAEPRLPSIEPVGNSTLDGSFLVSLQDSGAATVGMDYIGMGPKLTNKVGGTVNFDLCHSFIFVDEKGSRFYPENGWADLLAEAVIQSPKQLMFAVCDSEVFESLLPDARKAFLDAVAKGDATSAPTLEKLGNFLGIAVESLENTVSRFNESVIRGSDPLGRPILPKMKRISKPPYYGVRLTLGVVVTLGGLVITPRAEVVDRSGKPISGLYAAGEVTGGIHGTNRLGGNPLLAAFTFGRIAGNEASK